MGLKLALGTFPSFLKRDLCNRDTTTAIHFMIFFSYSLQVVQLPTKRRRRPERGEGNGARAEGKEGDKDT